MHDIFIEFMYLLGEIFIRVLGKMGVRQAREYTLLGCLAVAVVMMVVISAVALGVFADLMALLGWASQL